MKTSNDQLLLTSSSVLSVVVRLKNDPDRNNNQEISFYSIKTEEVASSRNSSFSYIGNNTIIRVKKEEKEVNNAIGWDQQAENDDKGDDDEDISSKTPGIIGKVHQQQVNKEEQVELEQGKKLLDHLLRTIPIPISITFLIVRKGIGVSCYHYPPQL